MLWRLTNGNNNALDPDTFTSLEAGVKWDINPGLSLTGAVFEIEQSSPQPNDNDPSTLDVIESTIEGFELQVQGEIPKSLTGLTESDTWQRAFGTK